MTIEKLTRVMLSAVGPIADIAAAAIGGSLPSSALVLIFGLTFVAGFAAGLVVEERNLRTRERRLARGRRRLAIELRALRQQVVEFHRLRDEIVRRRPPALDDIESKLQEIATSWDDDNER